MSKSEDYLDDLLNAVSSKNGRKKGPSVSSQGSERVVDPDKAFLDEFEKQLLEDDGDDQFLRDFEMELNEEESDPLDEGVESNQVFFENLDGIVNSAKQKMTEKENDTFGSDSDFEVDTLTESLDDESKSMMNQDQKDGFGGFDSLDASDFGGNDFDEFGLDESSDFNDESTGERASEDATDSDLGNDSDLMSLLQSDEELSDIGDMLKADEQNTRLSEDAEGDTSDEGKKKGKKGKDGAPKQGFLAKLSLILFGEDEDEEEQEEKVSLPTESSGIEELSAENLDILKELEGTKPASDALKEEDKKDKKEKKKKEKKKKEKKEKKPKVKKEKKPKPPKEKDNTPPLPKVPVILMFVMAASFMLLVLLGSNLVNYSNAVKEARTSFDTADYVSAYEQLSGLSIKDKDQTLYEQAKILAVVSGQFDSYQVFVQSGDYDMALDSLICAVGRYDLNYADAETYGCTVELNLVEQNVENALSEQFGLTADQARDLYGLKSREDYTIELYSIIQNLGLEKVTEE